MIFIGGERTKESEIVFQGRGEKKERRSLLFGIEEIENQPVLSVPARISPNIC